MTATPIWVVRPEPGNSATMRRLSALGLTAQSLPLFRGEPVPWAVPAAEGLDLIMLTSANALRLAGPDIAHYRDLPLWAVGEATAAAAREAGLAVARTGAAGVAELLADVQGRILWLCGAERSEVPARPGLHVLPVPVYRMAETPVAADSFGESGIILLHSARAARRIADLITHARPSFTLVAISGEVARAAGDGWQGLHIAASPSDAEMVAVAARLCQ